MSDAPDLFVVSLGDGETYSNIISIIRETRPRVPRAKWILLCRRNDDVFSREAVAAGIDGLLFEDSTGELLQHVVDLVLHGYHCAPSSVPPVSFEQTNIKPLQRLSTSADIKMRPFAGNGSLVDKRPLDREAACDAEANVGMGMKPQGSQAEQKMRQAVSLSEREKEIMHCLMGGHSNKLIARQLHISEATVKVHVKALLRKMQVANRTQAAICALNLVRQSEHVERVEETPQVSLGERTSSAMSMATC